MTLHVCGAQINLIDQGSGTPMLFLHGNPDSSEIWSGLIPSLSRQHRCIAPDLPGFGHSSAPPDFDCSLEGLAAFVDEFVQAAGIAQPLHLVVHDLGGPYGLAWAAKHPHKVRSLVIMNTAFSSRFRWHLMGQLWRTPVIGELVQLLTNRVAFARAMRRGSRNLSAEQINRTYDRVTPAMKRMVLRLYRALDTDKFKGWEDRVQDLAARVPSLVLWGDHDPYVPVRFAAQFGAQQVVHFPDCGHWLPAEAPQEVLERLLPFLAKASAPPATETAVLRTD
jgi:pimeloyl-ACP methyl ester carboxylesterase